ncbi:MAG: restriction endonuclease subunit S [Candidatus Sungbacteria bacterium]|nr:restriction endonuclease subunit S [Candidatus Sungbacteria bacterium]
MQIKTKTTWQGVKFKDFVKLQRGFDLPQQNRVSGEYPVIASTSIVDHHTAYKVEAPCVTTGRSGALGEVLYVNQKCWPLNTALWVKDFKGNNPYFVYCVLKILHLEQYNSGAGVPTLNRNHLDELVIEIPPSPTQKQIADVLSAYDDLIENNTKRIKILEQIAQAIYREWFVYFRFPDHGKVKMIDSKTEFGKIPEGWKIGKLSDLAKITMGQSPSSDFYNEIGEGSPFHQGVTNFEFRFPTTTTFSTEGARKADEEDILFSVRAPVGRINVADRNIIIGRGLAAVKSISGNQSYLLYDFKHIFQTEDLIGGGAIFASVTKDDLNNFPVVIPDTKVIEQFESNVQPIDQLILNISHELSVLRNSRDLLLPKLVSGEIQV